MVQTFQHKVDTVQISNVHKKYVKQKHILEKLK